MSRIKLAQIIEKLDSIEIIYDLDMYKSEVLGKKSWYNKELKTLRDLDEQQKRDAAASLNEYKKEVEKLFFEARNKITIALKQLPKRDITLPRIAEQTEPGYLHLITKLQMKILPRLASYGYNIVDGPEIETEEYNFDKLNIPKDHPARDMWDTFYVNVGEKQYVPRTHTSPMQIRYGEDNKLPIKVLVPGKVYRNEAEDATHLWNFFQLEGLVVDKGISLANLKAELINILAICLEKDPVDIKLRLRPSFFPFTEPSVEVDVMYNGKWLEVAGSGLVHPSVIENMGHDSSIYSGYAFGLGLDRIAAIRYDISDIRKLWRPDFVFNNRMENC